MSTRRAEKREAEREKACVKKIPYMTLDTATTELNRLNSQDIYPQKTPRVVYLCPFVLLPDKTYLGRHYHVGHTPYWCALTSTERLLNKKKA